MPLPVRRNKDDARFDPFSELRHLQDQLSSYLERWTGSPSLVEGTFTPLADVEETDDAWIAEIELPGIDKRDLEIEVSTNRLSVSGERHDKVRTGNVRRHTRTVGRFHFELTVPEAIDPDKVQADLEHGVLTVRIPKPADSTPRRIQVS